MGQWLTESPIVNDQMEPLSTLILRKIFYPCKFNVSFRYFQCKSNDLFPNDKNIVLNLFHATGIFLYPLKTSENLFFLTFSGGCIKRSVA